MKRSLLLVFLLAPVFVFAQANFKKGYRLTNNGDTVLGYINYVERNKTPESFSFKTHLNENRQSFNLQNSAGFGIKDYEVYRRYLVNLSLSSENISDLTIGPDTSSKEATVFLKILETGKNVTLFSYADQVKTRFFILEQGKKQPVELIKEMFYKENTTSLVVTNPKYSTQLLQLLKKYNAHSNLEDQLVNLSYDEDDLRKIAAALNDKKTQKSKYKVARYFVGGGVNFSRLDFNGVSNAYTLNKPVNNKPSVMPYLSSGIDLFFKPEIGRFIFRTELILSYNKSQIDNKTGDQSKYYVHRFNQFNIDLSPQLIYNIYNTDPLKAFIGGGADLNYSFYNNNESLDFDSDGNIARTRKDEPKLENFYFGASVSAGIVLNKRFQIMAKYFVPAPITNYQLFSEKASGVKVGFNYLINR